MEAPSTFLPRLKRLDEYTGPELHAAIAKLVVLYLPEVRGTTPVDEDVEILQADSFERSFAIRWLTGFISRGAEWAEFASDEDDSDTPSSTSDTAVPDEHSLQPLTLDTYTSRNSALNRATGLLAACAGTSASGALSRTFTFPTSVDSAPISITLRDESLSVGDHTAVGLQTWGSACVLAERVSKSPSLFGLGPQSSSRVLELGAGTGLLSLLAGKLSAIDQEQGGPGHTVIATDYHPAVMENLRTNVKSNFPRDSSVSVHALDWSLYTTGKATTGLSRAPSTAVTPIGTPRVDGEFKADALMSSPGLEAPTSVLPTPSASFTSSLSPPSPQTPQTPRTPHTSRSPPPNLARAVFSRLKAKGVKFDMPAEKGTKMVDSETEKPKGTLADDESHKPFELATNTEPNNSTVSPNEDHDEHPPWVDTLNQSPRRPSADIDPDSMQSTSPLLCDSSLAPCLELDGRTIYPNPRMDVRQGYLDTSNSHTDVLVKHADGPTGTEPLTSASLSPTPIIDETKISAGKSCGNSAERVELKQGNRIGLEEWIEAVSDNLGATGAGVSQSDIGAGKSFGHRPTYSPCAPPAHMSAPPFDRPFDVIFGADIIYELSHATLVSDVVQRLLRKPSHAANLPPAYFHLIMPLRPTHADESTSVDQTFPRVEDVHLQKEGGEEVLAIVHTETYARSAGVGRADEVQYVYYRMAWV